MKTCLLVSVLVFAFASSSSAQAADPQIPAFKLQYDIVKGYVTKSAEKVSAELYSYQPTPDVRSFGKILGHIADANYMFCSSVKGEKSPMEMQAIEKGKTTKADLQKALAESYAYCDGVYGSLAGAQLADKVEFFGMPQTKLSLLALNTAHNFEHYGNLVTYMRMKQIVPPSSEPREMPGSAPTPSN